MCKSSWSLDQRRLGQNVMMCLVQLVQFDQFGLSESDGEQNEAEIFVPSPGKSSEQAVPAQTRTTELESHSFNTCESKPIFSLPTDFKQTTLFILCALIGFLLHLFRFLY